MIYFDNAATSYYRPSCVKEAVAEAIENFGNPSRGAYGASLDADRCLFETRLQLGDLFGADGPACVSFTMNDTHALNEAIFGVGLGPGDHLIVSLQEHNSVLRPAYRLRECGVEVHFTGLKKDGTFDIDDYRRILEEIRGEAAPEFFSAQKPRVVTALTQGSNVTGNLIDLKAVSQLCKTYRSLLIIDAAQTAGIVPINMKEDGIDILCMSGHKALMGPQGTGAIIVRRGLLEPNAVGREIASNRDVKSDEVSRDLAGRILQLSPLMVGGSGIKTFLETMPEDMPARLEAGTQNAHSIAGLHAALSFAEGKREEWRQQEMKLKKLFLCGIRSINEEAKKKNLCYGSSKDDMCEHDLRSGNQEQGVVHMDREVSGEVIHIYGNPEAEESLPTVAFNIRGFEAGDIADRLWRDKEIAVRAGGHCAPLIHKFFGTERRGIVRASFSHFNTEEQVEVLVEELRSIVREAG